MRKLIPALLLVLITGVFAQADLCFLVDDNGSSSNVTLIAPHICDPMTEIFTYEIVTDNGDTGVYAADPAWWSDYRLVIWYAMGANANGRELTEAERAAADGFISNGGHLMVTGPDLVGAPNDPIMAQLIRSVGIGNGPTENSATITDENHFIADGPYGTYTGTFTLNGNSNHDHFIPSQAQGCIEIMVVDNSSYSKIMFCQTGQGSVTAWGGNCNQLDWWDIDELGNMARNWISESLTTTALEATTWGQIKADF